MPATRLSQLEGSSMVRSINDRFTATMTNNVRWQDAPSCSTDDGCVLTLTVIQNLMLNLSHGYSQGAPFRSRALTRGQRQAFRDADRAGKDPVLVSATKPLERHGSWMLVTSAA